MLISTKSLSFFKTKDKQNSNNFQNIKRNVHLTKHKTTTGSAVVTIFGATGFVGRHVVNRFARNGAQVIIPYRFNEMDYAHLKPIGEVGQIIPIKFHPKDSESIEKAVAKSNIVVNLIGKRWATRNYSFHDSNVDTAKEVAMACKKYGVERFIHTSALGADLKSPSEFLQAKAESEDVVRSIFPDVTIIRPAPMFGHYDFFLNRFGRVGQFSNYGLFLMIDPETLLQPLFVDDFALPIISIVEDEETKGKVFEFGGPETFSVRELFTEIILPGSQRKQKPIFHIPEHIAKKICKIVGSTRRPIWIADDPSYFKNHLIASPNGAQWDQWKIQRSTVADHAVNILRFFRPAGRVNV